jgi:hypothetical protein
MIRTNGIGEMSANAEGAKFVETKKTPFIVDKERRKELIQLSLSPIGMIHLLFH